MIIQMKLGAIEGQIKAVEKRIRSLGFDLMRAPGESLVVIAVLGQGTGDVDTQTFSVFPGVERVVRIKGPGKTALRSFKPSDTVVDVGEKSIGSGLSIIAGPCSVESEDQMLACAWKAKECGAVGLRGGAFKPRSSPDGFQGLKEEGLKILAKARNETGLFVVTEVIDTCDVDLVASCADVLQIGARNSQNFRLIEAAGKSGKPVLLKRGLSGHLSELLGSADYALRQNGASNVILCLRGIRTFEQELRFTPDIGAIPVLQQMSHLPVVFDPSHPAGHIDFVPSIALSAIAAGAQGLIIEIHPEPHKALSDGAQSLSFNQFANLMSQVKILVEAMKQIAV